MPQISNQRAVLLSLAVYLIWFAFTCLLEGWTHTFLRPEAVVEHEIYRVANFVVANVIVGIILAILTIRHLVSRSIIIPSQSGFRSLSRTLVTVAVGAVLGFVVYVVLGGISLSFDPIVMLNGYAQGLSGAIATVLICWALAGTLFVSLTKRKGRVMSVIVGTLTSSFLFGVYHFALAAPVNTVEVVLETMVLGVATSLFFFISHEIYGSIVFSGFQWMFGALHAQGNLGSYSQPLYLFYAMALISLIVLVAMDMRLIRPMQQGEHPWKSSCIRGQITYEYLSFHQTTSGTLLWCLLGE